MLKRTTSPPLTIQKACLRSKKKKKLLAGKMRMTKPKLEATTSTAEEQSTAAEENTTASTITASSMLSSPCNSPISQSTKSLTPPQQRIVVVSFARPLIAMTHTIQAIAPQDRNDVWISRDDYQTRKAHDKLLALRILEGEDVDGDSIRGLESRLQEEKDFERRAKSLAVVFREQQQEETSDNSSNLLRLEDRIRTAYRAASTHARHMALALGRQDACECQRIWGMSDNSSNSTSCRWDAGSVVSGGGSNRNRSPPPPSDIRRRRIHRELTPPRRQGVTRSSSSEVLIPPTRTGSKREDELRLQATSRRDSLDNMMKINQQCSILETTTTTTNDCNPRMPQRWSGRNSPILLQPKSIDDSDDEQEEEATCINAAPSPRTAAATLTSSQKATQGAMAA